MTTLIDKLDELNINVSGNLYIEDGEITIVIYKSGNVRIIYEFDNDGCFSVNELKKIVAVAEKFRENSNINAGGI